MQDNSSELSLNEITGITHKPTGSRISLEDELKSHVDIFREPLTREQFNEAKSDLHINSYVEKFPKTIKYSVDEHIPEQVYSLHSFIPSTGAKPDSDGVFGLIKFRGSYQTVDMANENADKMIRSQDSYNTIYTSYTGKWFPVTESSKWTKDIHEVDIQKKTREVVSSSIKDKREDEKKQIQEIRRREEDLRNDTGTQVKDKNPMETYLECMVKKANCLYTLERYKKDIKRLEEVLDQSKNIIQEFDATQPELKEGYKDIYRKAREEVGLPVSETETLIHYMEK